MNRRTLLGAVGTASTVGLAGCQETVEDLIEDAGLSGSDELPGDGEVTLESAAAKPGHTVGISGPVEQLGDEPLGWLYDATVEDPGEDDRHPIHVDVEEAFLVVPVHPGDHMGGGPAEIEILDEDDEVVAPGIEFEVEPLDPAPGTLAGAIDSLEAALLEGAETFGYSAGELRAADPGELPPHVVGIAAGLQAVEGGETGAIRTLLGGNSDVLEADQHDEAGLEVVDALAHETGFADELAAVGDVFSGIEDPPTPVPAAGTVWGSGTVRGGSSGTGAGESTGTVAEESPLGPGFGKTAPVSGSGQDTLGGPRRWGGPRSEGLGATAAREGILGIEAVADLDYWMDVQSRFADANQGTAAAARDAGGIVIAGCAFVPGAQGAAAAGGAMLTVMQLAIDLTEGQLPSILEIEPSADPAEYMEDQDFPGTLSASLAGHSEGFTLTWPDKVGTIPLVGRAVNVVNRAPTEATREFNSALVEFVQESLTAIWGNFEQEGWIELSPRSYGPVETDPDEDGEFLETDAEVIESETGEEPFEISGDGWTYEPRAVGVSQLFVRSRDDAFGGADASGSVMVEVNELEVIIREAEMNTSANIYYLDPEEDPTISFYAAVQGAEDEGVAWTFDRVEGPAVPWPTPSGPNNSEITFDVAAVDISEDERAQYVFEAESTTEDGLRAGRDPPRTDRVRIVVTDDEEEEAENLVVGPSPGCLDPDEAHELTATLDGAEIGFEELTWRIEGEGDGDITPDGLFVPSAEGEVYLEFWLDDDRDVTSELLFRVSEECTELTIQIDEDGSTTGQVYNCVMAISLSGPGGSGTHISTETRWLDGERTELRLEFFGDVFAQAEGEEATYTGGVTVDNVDDDATSGQRDWYPVPFTVTRTVEPGAAHDGTDLDVISGEFGPASTGDPGSVYGEFHGVRYDEDGCGQYVP